MPAIPLVNHKVYFHVRRMEIRAQEKINESAHAAQRAH